MELYIFLALILATIIPLLFQFVANSRKRLPPGTFGWPVIGETIPFLNAFQNGKAHEFVKERTEKYHSNVVKTSLLGEKFAILSGPAAIKFIFSNEKKLVTGWRTRALRKLLPSTAFTNVEDEPKKLRSLIGLFFKSDMVENLVHIIDSIARDHFKNFWQYQSEVKVYDHVRQFSFAAACRIMLSIEDPKLVSRLFYQSQIFTAGLITIDLNVPGTSFYRAKQAAKALRKEVGSIVEQRREALAKNPAAEVPKDILTQMLSVPGEDGNYMSEMEIVDKFVSLVAGNETSVATITFTMKYLADKPEFHNEVIKEQKEIIEMMKPRDHLCWDDIKKMKKTWNFVSEVMRLVKTVQATFRDVKTDFTYDGFLVPKGWKILLALGCTDMNPNYFTEPEKFDPSRFEGNGIEPYTFIPFGGGPRVCPGKEFAKVNILIFLHYLLKMFRWEIMVPDERVIHHLVPSPLEGFPVRLFPLQN